MNSFHSPSHRVLIVAWNHFTQDIGTAWNIGSGFLDLHVYIYTPLLLSILTNRQRWDFLFPFPFSAPSSLSLSQMTRCQSCFIQFHPRPWAEREHRAGARADGNTDETASFLPKKERKRERKRTRWNVGSWLVCSAHSFSPWAMMHRHCLNKACAQTCEWWIALSVSMKWELKPFSEKQ